MARGSNQIDVTATAVERPALLIAGCFDHFEKIELTVSGTCMSPALQPGERVLLASRHCRRPRFGDVVLSRQRKGLRLHRLVWAPPGGLPWRTQADRGGGVDSAIRREDVLGTVVAVAQDSRRPTRSPLRALAGLVRATGLRLGWR